MSRHEGPDVTGVRPALVAETARDLYVRALKVLPPDVKVALARAHGHESHPRAREILGTMLRNLDVAEARGLMVCQDTGTPVFRVRVGRRFPFDVLGGHAIREALAEGVRRAAGMYALVFKRGDVRFFADTTVNIDPDAETLAEIAISCADAPALRTSFPPRPGASSTL